MSIHIDLDSRQASVERNEDGFGLRLTIDVPAGEQVSNHRPLHVDPAATIAALGKNEVIHRGKVALLSPRISSDLDPNQARDLAAVLVHLADEADR